MNHATKLLGSTQYPWVDSVELNANVPAVTGAEAGDRNKVRRHELLADGGRSELP